MHKAKMSRFKIIWRLLKMTSSLAHIIILATLSGSLGHLVAIFITVVSGYGVLNILGIENSISIKQTIITLAILAISRGVLRYIEQTSNHYLAFKMLAILRDKIFKALRRLSPAKLETKDKGNLISIITSDVELLEVFFAHTISPVAIAITVSLFMVFFIGKYDYKLALIALIAYIFIGVVIPYITSKSGKEDGAQNRNVMGDMNDILLDGLRGMKESIQYRYAEKMYEKIESAQENLNSSNEKLKKHEGNSFVYTNIAIIIFSISVLLVSSKIYLEEGGSIAMVIIPTIAMISSFGPVVALSSLMNNLLLTLACGERVLDILDEEPVVEEIKDGKDVKYENLKVEDLSFKYDREEVLSNINMEIDKNEIVAITGKSGSGKSTLLKLMMRFWDVQDGSIKISDTNIKEINTDNLRDIESLVTQETIIFDESIKDNLRIAKKDATDEEIMEACKKASIHDFVENLPDGYDTRLGELGSRLSGGEKQRIGVARAFLHDSSLMLLDEPTSNLDSLNEGVILRALQKYRGEKTIVIVSHRQSTLNIADKNYNIDDGRVS
ncbi:MAG: ABC transporter ATP-binding protein [Andreesenia angusta]|nr:ABC transporter ATP-binding protein [Andreesenia angusta]